MSNIDFEHDGLVATIVLNRPEKLNTITPQMTRDLNELIKTCNDDVNIRVLILTGAGEKSFCAGSDVNKLDTYRSDWEFRNRLDYCDAIRSIRKPVIAAINGYAYGGGLELCLNSDIRIASQTASFCAAEIKLGWIGGGGVSFYLTQNIGASNAAKMILTGEPIDAKQALDWRLISDIYSPGELLPAAKALANKIAGTLLLQQKPQKRIFALPTDYPLRRQSIMSGICKRFAWQPKMQKKEERPSRKSVNRCSKGNSYSSSTYSPANPDSMAYPRVNSQQSLSIDH